METILSESDGGGQKRSPPGWGARERRKYAGGSRRSRSNNATKSGDCAAKQRGSKEMKR
jgi:hypothetical protein